MTPLLGLVVGSTLGSNPWPRAGETAGLVVPATPPLRRITTGRPPRRFCRRHAHARAGSVPAVTIHGAGPMPGLPEHHYPAFHATAAVLRSAGYEPISPARPGLATESTRPDYMERGLSDVLDADGLALLPGRDRSLGPCLEIEVAETWDLPVRALDRLMVAGGVLS